MFQNTRSVTQVHWQFHNSTVECSLADFPRSKTGKQLYCELFVVREDVQYSCYSLEKVDDNTANTEDGAGYTTDIVSLTVFRW